MRWVGLLVAMACGTPLEHGESPAGEAPRAGAKSSVVAELQRHPLVYTKHARCRMRCRQLDEEEILEVLHSGVLDPGRTRHDGRCPSYALEGTTYDGQRARVVFAGCEGETRVVTAIDLGREWPCDCS